MNENGGHQDKQNKHRPTINQWSHSYMKCDRLDLMETKTTKMVPKS